MLLEFLRVRDFRNIAAVDLEPHPRFNILWGQNAQGKTNLLEAVYLLSAVKSFRPQTNADLIRFDTREATLEARVDRGGSQRIVRVDINPRGKKVFLNENVVRVLADFFGSLNVVMFGPEDIGILKGGPAERRRFIDRAIFNGHPSFASLSQNYDEVIKNRNAVLKADKLDATLLSIYDEQLVNHGAEIVQRRLDFLRHFGPVLQRSFTEIFQGGLEAEIRYDAKWIPEEVDVSAPPDRARIEGWLHGALERTFPEQRARGFTVVGPHRDDLATTLDGRPVRLYGSQGQHRAFVLAMKIAEITYLEERYHFAPVLLLDDVSSELDRERNALLFEFLRSREDGQVFITTTHRDYIHLDQDVSAWQVVAGEVTPTESS